jgi:nitric oxide reductase subunit B
MTDERSDTASLSPWWRHAAILVMIFGFSTLSFVTVQTYDNAPPIPARVVEEAGGTIFTHDDVLRGQEVFFKYGLMEHGSLWGHGAYLGPDYSAEYLHRLAEIARDTLARQRYGTPHASLERGPALEIAEQVRGTLKTNRYRRDAQGVALPTVGATGR